MKALTFLFSHFFFFQSVTNLKMLVAQAGINPATYSQGGEGTKVRVFLSCRGAISFYVHIIPSGLISIFLDGECDKTSGGLKPTRFLQNFLQNTLLTKRRNFIFISWKYHLCHQKGDKKLHIKHYYGYFDF